jgi:argininosuccinate synthase
MAMVLLAGTRKEESVAVNAGRITWIAEQKAARRTEITICFDKGNTVKVRGTMAEVFAALERATAA